MLERLYSFENPKCGNQESSLFAIFVVNHSLIDIRKRALYSEIKTSGTRESPCPFFGFLIAGLTVLLRKEGIHAWVKPYYG